MVTAKQKLMENFGISLLHTFTHIAKESELINFEHVADISTGCSYQILDYPEEELNAVKVIDRFVGNELIFSQDKYMRITEREIIKYKFRTNDIVFSHRNAKLGLGQTALFDSEKTVIHTARYLRIRPREIYDSAFLFLLLEIYRHTGKLVQLAGTYTNLMAINVSSLNKMQVPLLDEDQQRTILAEAGYFAV